MGEATEAVRSAKSKSGYKHVRWTHALKQRFFDHLTATCNVRAAAAAAGVPAKAAYGLRRRDEAFAADWRVAVANALEIIETHLLALALSGEEAIDTGVGGPGAVIDREMALRLLARHSTPKPGAQHRGGPRRKLLTDAEVEAALLAKLAKLVPQPAAEPA